MKVKRISIGFGSILSLIIIYFIYLYAKDKGWTLLAFLSKGYLMIVLGFFLWIIGIIILIILIFLIPTGMLFFKVRRKKSKKKDDFIDVEYKVKE
jgi:predicted membrane protein